MSAAGALVHEAAVWEALTGGAMPTGTRLEKALTKNAALVRQEGLLGVWAKLHARGEAGRACVGW